MDLHGKIMNIQVERSKIDWAIKTVMLTDPDFNYRLALAYKYGHRDARHAAAELACLPPVVRECETNGYWWCPECEEEVDGRNVTFHEEHDKCWRYVEWKEPLADTTPCTCAPQDAELAVLPPEPMTCLDKAPFTYNKDEWAGTVGKALPPDPRPCETCGGKGYTAEHSPGLNDHDGEGNCVGACPVQVQCEHCNGTGVEPCAPQSADVEKVREYRRLLISALDALYEAMEIAPFDRIPRKAGGVIQDIQATIGDDAAMDRIVGKEE